MRLFSIAALASITLGIALAGPASCVAQSAQTTQQKKVFGYQDPQTGVFHPLARAVPQATTITPTIGKYEVTFSITIDSTFPKGATLLCNVDILETSVTVSPAAVSTYEETASASLTVSGKTATCTVAIPYSWVIPASTAKSPVETTVSGSYSVFVFNASGTTITSATLEGLRSTSSSLPIPTTVPKDGATTTASVDATL